MSRAPHCQFVSLRGYRGPALAIVGLPGPALASVGLRGRRGPLIRAFVGFVGCRWPLLAVVGRH